MPRYCGPHDKCFTYRWQFVCSNEGAMSWKMVLILQRVYQLGSNVCGGGGGCWLVVNQHKRQCRKSNPRFVSNGAQSPTTVCRINGTSF